MSLESLLPDDSHPNVHDYTVALGGRGRLLDRLTARGVDVHVVPVQGWRWFEKRRTAVKLLASGPLQLLSVARWAGFIRRQRTDLVHLNSNRLIEPLVAAWCLRVPTIVHFRDMPSRMTTPFLLGCGAFYGLMNRATRWIANSRATAEDIRPYARVPVVAIPNGLDLADFDRRAREAREARQERPEARPSGVHVAMVALVNPWKRYECFIDVAAAVVNRRPDVRFSIVGTGSDGYVRSLRAMCAARGLDRAVTFAGHVENVPAYLRSVDVLAHTADPEPFGRVFLEAMAGQRPVVAFRSGGPAEIVVDGSTGRLVEPGDVNAMADALLGLLADASMRERFGAAGRLRVEEHYSAERCRASVAAQYEAILGPI